MKLKQYQVDAFARWPFEGNPAAVCPLERWLPDGLLAMDFPALPPHSVEAPAALAETLGCAPAEVLAAKDYLVVLESEAAVRALAPDMGKLRALDRRANYRSAAASCYAR